MVEKGKFKKIEKGKIQKIEKGKSKKIEKGKIQKIKKGKIQKKSKKENPKNSKQKEKKSLSSIVLDKMCVFCLYPISDSQQCVKRGSCRSPILSGLLCLFSFCLGLEPICGEIRV